VLARRRPRFESSAGTASIHLDVHPQRRENSLDGYVRYIKVLISFSFYFVRYRKKKTRRKQNESLVMIAMGDNYRLAVPLRHDSISCSYVNVIVCVPARISVMCVRVCICARVFANFMVVYANWHYRSVIFDRSA
jgi:hypothetical protein